MPSNRTTAIPISGRTPKIAMGCGKTSRSQCLLFAQGPEVFNMAWFLKKETSGILNSRGDLTN